MKKPRTEPALLSVYGSADTGIIGVESSPLVQIRQFLSLHPETAQRIGMKSPVIPNLFHFRSSKTYLEIVNDEMIITQWQGLPLVRYNLQDHVQFFGWKTLCQEIRRDDPNRAAFWSALESAALPDVISITGRSQGCLFLCGSNIFEPMLQAALLQSLISQISNGAFVVWTESRHGQQVLCWQIELKNGQAAPNAELCETFHAELVDLLGKQQPEFAEDYERFYRPFESQGLRIFQFHFSAFGELSGHPQYQTGIKRKTIIPAGPLANSPTSK
jgi:phenylacetate-CoA ligase